MSEAMAPTLTVSGYCDTELGSLFQRRMPHLEDGQFHDGENAPVPRRRDDAGPFGLIHLCCEIAMRQQK